MAWGRRADAEGLDFLASGNHEINVQKLTHFALGIFWKASIHQWLPEATGTLIELGPYSDRIRLWLRDEADFPHHVYLIAMVAPPQRSHPGFLIPYEEEHQGFRGFAFRVAGLTFALRIGKVVDEATRLFCFTRAEHPVIVSDELTAKSERVLIEHFHRNRKTKAFLRQMETQAIQRRKPT